MVGSVVKKRLRRTTTTFNVSINKTELFQVSFSDCGIVFSTTTPPPSDERHDHSVLKASDSSGFTEPPYEGLGSRSGPERPRQGAGPHVAPQYSRASAWRRKILLFCALVTGLWG